MVTFTTVFNAKGNESGKVYVIGTDVIYQNKNYIGKRNMLFTAITRAKGWITITGFGKKMNECISEFEELKNNNFLLKFIQPSDSEVKTLAHEMEKEARMIDESRKQIGESAKALGITVEDYLNKI